MHNVDKDGIGNVRRTAARSTDLSQLLPNLTLVTDLPESHQRQLSMRVALVNMPFGSTRYPSMQLGLLQAILARRGISAKTQYLNLEFAARAGWEQYEWLCDVRCHNLGEWIFAKAAFDDLAPDASLFLDMFGDELHGKLKNSNISIDMLLDLREQKAPAFLRECLEMVPWGDYDVVGFTSTFEQNCAALGLARLIKEKYPHVITVFGGANFEDVMGLEYMRALSWIDYAIIGEADKIFPELLEHIAAGDIILDIPGVVHRTGDHIVFSGRGPMMQNLDNLPVPEYDDYFTTAAKLNIPWVMIVLFESSRGCWWGAKQHCTFCGLNGLGMAFRSKSPERVLVEIHELARRYNIYNFQAVDNILDHKHIEQVLGKLIEDRFDYHIFYEVKANLSPQQLRTLARSGVRTIQPGIESLSSHVLELMRKGTSAIQNVRLLKWALYYGMSVNWNILTGFPDELVIDYESQLAIMRLIPHLQPPDSFGRFWLERFSPLHSSSEEFSITNVRADRGYTYIYPRHIDFEKIAYFFEYDIVSSYCFYHSVFFFLHFIWVQHSF